jgi:hypothetical protein
VRQTLYVITQERRSLIALFALRIDHPSERRFPYELPPSPSIARPDAMATRADNCAHQRSTATLKPRSTAHLLKSHVLF